MMVSYEEIEDMVRESVSVPDSEKDFLEEVLKRMDEAGEEEGSSPEAEKTEKPDPKKDPPKKPEPEEKPVEKPLEKDEPEEPAPEKSPFGGDGPEGPSPEEKPPEEKPEPPKPSYSSLGDMLSKTETEVSVQKTGTEPSPIFGPNDTKPHDKWKVTLRNGNGSTNFVFWSSIADTENGTTPTRDEMIASIAQDCGEYGNSMSLDEFRERFGYEDSDMEIAQKSYDGFRQLVEDVRKMFPDGGFEEFVRLGTKDPVAESVVHEENADDLEIQWEEYSTEAVDNYVQRYEKEHGHAPSAEEENAFYEGLSYFSFGEKAWKNVRKKKSSDGDEDLPF